jgi:hypothetical protein
MRSARWTDSHLHRFASGPDSFGAQVEHYLWPFDVDERDTGIPAGYVRINKVLSGPGDRFFYSYDDDRRHVIVLEAALPATWGSGLATCSGGSRRGPAEDCGGTHIYELVGEAVFTSAGTLTISPTGGSQQPGVQRRERPGRCSRYLGGRCADGPSHRDPGTASTA